MKNDAIMKKERFICPYTVYDHLEELDPSDAELLRLAHEAARNAYAPYSKFNVGAAVRLANGEVVTGNNIDKTIDEPVAPCGACRQVMVEVEQLSKQPLRVLCQGETGPVFAFDGIESLMPFIFLDKFLG